MPNPYTQLLRTGAEYAAEHGAFHDGRLLDSTNLVAFATAAHPDPVVRADTLMLGFTHVHAKFADTTLADRAIKHCDHGPDCGHADETIAYLRKGKMRERDVRAAFCDADLDAIRSVLMSAFTLKGKAARRTVKRYNAMAAALQPVRERVELAGREAGHGDKAAWLYVAVASEAVDVVWSERLTKSLARELRRQDMQWMVSLMQALYYALLAHMFRAYITEDDFTALTLPWGDASTDGA